MRERASTPQRIPAGYMLLTLANARQLLCHAFAVLGPRSLVPAGSQRAGVGLAALRVARLAAVAWPGWSEFGGWCRLTHAVAPLVAGLGLARFDIPVEGFATRLVLRLGAVHGIRARAFSCGVPGWYCGNGAG